MHPRAPRWVRVVIACAPLLASCSGLVDPGPLNFHLVTEGQLYRSAQPLPGDLSRVVERYGIRSVINLRGELPGDEWWEAEVAESEILGLSRVDIGMSVRRLPHREDLLALIRAFEELPRPILVHCQAGADRTGEAVAMWLLDHQGLPVEEARLALHPRFGHITERWPAKLYFIDEIYQGRAWAAEHYRPCDETAWLYYDRAAFCPRPVATTPDQRFADSEGMPPG